MSNLSPKQFQILLNIRSGCNSFRGLNAAIGNGPTTGWMSQYLRELRAAGLVTWSPGQARTLQLTERGRAELADYCLLPDGGIGKWEKVEAVEMEPVR